MKVQVVANRSTKDVEGFRAAGKQPYYFTARDGSPILTAAGLWDSWKNPETGQPLLSCTMLITEPNSLVATVHDRMPVLLRRNSSSRGSVARPASRFEAGTGNDMLPKRGRCQSG